MDSPFDFIDPEDISQVSEEKTLELSERFSQVMDQLETENKENQNYDFVVFLEQKDEDGEISYHSSSLFASVEELNKNLIPYAIDFLADFLSKNNEFGLMKQTDIIAGSNESLDTLRAIYDNMNLSDRERIFTKKRAEDWKQLLVEEMGDMEAVFLHKKPYHTDFLFAQWSVQSLLEILFGEKFVLIHVDLNRNISFAETASLTSPVFKIGLGVIRKKSAPQTE